MLIIFYLLAKEVSYAVEEPPPNTPKVCVNCDQNTGPMSWDGFNDVYRHCCADHCLVAIKQAELEKENKIEK